MLSEHYFCAIGYDAVASKVLRQQIGLASLFSLTLGNKPTKKLNKNQF